MLEFMLGASRPNYKYKLTPLRDAPNGLSHICACLYNNKIWIAGGLTPTLQSSNAFSCYDIATDTWTILPNMPATIRSGAIGGHNGKIYQFGGINHSNSVVDPNIRVFDIAANTWVTKQETMSPVRFEMGYEVVDGGKIWLMGGMNSNTMTNNTSTDLNNPTIFFDSYAATPSPGPRAAGTYYDGSRYIYTAGGLDNGSTYLNHFRRYDILNNTWATLAPMPVNATFVNLIAWDGNIYAFTTNANTVYGNRLFRYSVSSDTWTDLGAVDGQIHGLTKGIVYKNELYLICGWNGSARDLKVSKLSRY